MLVLTTKFRSKRLQVGNVGSAGYPKAYLLSGNQDLDTTDQVLIPGNSAKNKNVIWFSLEKEAGAWHGKWHSLPSLSTKIIDDDAISQTVPVTEV